MTSLCDRDRKGEEGQEGVKGYRGFGSGQLEMPLVKKKKNQNQEELFFRGKEVISDLGLFNLYESEAMCKKLVIWFQLP